MYTDDHCGRCVGLLEQPAPLRDSLTVTSEDDCFGRVRWNVHRDLPATVVLERPVTNAPRRRGWAWPALRRIHLLAVDMMRAGRLIALPSLE